MSHLEIFCWTDTRANYEAGMKTAGLMDQSGALLYGIQASEIGDVVKVHAVVDAEGNVTTPAVMVGGFHVNLRVEASSPFGQQMTAGLPQYNSDGSLKTLFERTHVLSFVPGLTWEALPNDGKVPAGYRGPNGVVLYDASAVTSRRNVWQ